MGVERVAWKRGYIQQNHPGLRFLFGEAAHLCEPTCYCFLHEEHAPWPHCEILSVGSSGTDFSSLRGHLSRSSSRDVLEGTGASGSTLRYAMAYIDAHRPSVLLLENVVGLFKGFLRKDPVTWKLDPIAAVPAEDRALCTTWRREPRAAFASQSAPSLVALLPCGRRRLRRCPGRVLRQLGGGCERIV